LYRQTEYLIDELKGSRKDGQWLRGETNRGGSHWYDIFHNENSSIQDLAHSLTWSFIRPADKQGRIEKIVKFLKLT
jgi:hypothetical protein